MAEITIRTIAKKMKDLDYCMMVTSSKGGMFTSRPMSNNRDVKYNGDSFFFTYEKSQKIKDIQADSNVLLNFEGKDMLMISVAGKAKLIRNKEAFADHWVDELEMWFKDGIDTKGMVLIHVKGRSIRYWQKEKEGTIKLAARK